MLSAMLLASCNVKDDIKSMGGTENTASVTTEAAKADLTAVWNDMKACEKMPQMIEFDANAMLDTCGIKAEDCVSAVVAVSSDGLLADEVWLIEAKDEDALARITDLANKRIIDKDESSKTYSPEQNKIVKDAQIITKGNVLALIVSPDVDELAKVFNDAVS